MEEPVSRIDVFTGYSYLTPHATVNTTLLDGSKYPLKYGSVDYGAIGSVAYFMNRYVGGVAEYANHELGRNDGFHDLMGGLIMRLPSHGATPFVHVMAGGIKVGGPNGEPVVYHRYTWGTGLKAGGGLDFDGGFFHHHVGIRVFQADYIYMHADFGPQPVDGGR
ncbi:MAG TPA: hypothetical protein VGD62_09815, partial [Acidobacteriaceae bacterium]